jgi:hypothetical protein
VTLHFLFSTEIVNRILYMVTLPKFSYMPAPPSRTYCPAELTATEQLRKTASPYAGLLMYKLVCCRDMLIYIFGVFSYRFSRFPLYAANGRSCILELNIAWLSVAKAGCFWASACDDEGNNMNCITCSTHQAEIHCIRSDDGIHKTQA